MDPPTARRPAWQRLDGRHDPSRFPRPPNRRRRRPRRVGCLSRPAIAADADKPAPASPEAIQFFEAKIRPVLADNCFRCHGPSKQRGGLRLDNRADALAGGDNGKAVVPGNTADSLLLQAVTESNPDLKPMPPPPNAKLSTQQIADLTQWVKMGAPWPGQEKAVAAASDHPPRQIRDHRQGPRPLGVSAGQAAGRARRQEHGLGRQPHRRLHPRQAGGERAATRTRRPRSAS